MRCRSLDYHRGPFGQPSPFGRDRILAGGCTIRARATATPRSMHGWRFASSYPKAKKGASLMFHAGASIPDPAGLLEGEGSVSRVARFSDAADLAAKRSALEGIIRSWIELKST